jgi:hypothetical protein
LRAFLRNLLDHEVKTMSPSAPVLLLTGWGEGLIAETSAPLHVDMVFSKPPKLREIREALASLCQATQAR